MTITTHGVAARAVARPRAALGALAAAGLMLAALAGCATVSQPSHKAVYHLNQGNEQATQGLRNIRNHLTAEPRAKITVVTHAAGIDFLLEGAQDRNGNPYDAIVQELVARGVDFRVCRFTLESRQIAADRVIPEATIVPSGVAEIARLQAREQYVYVKP